VDQSSDQELIRRICEHDADAFEALFARYQACVLQHLLRTLRDRTAAEDLTQEVFLRVWTRAEQWNGDGAFKSWALKIGTNLALNYLRTVRRRREQPLEPFLETEPVTGSEHQAIEALERSRPEQAFEQLEWRERLQQLLGRLSTEKREVFHLAHDADLDVREIAARLGIPEGTVRSRLHYARKQLATEWEMEEKER